jgi:hypothetical protein
MIFVTATMAANFVRDSGPGRAKYILKLVDSHSGRRLVVDGYQWMEL